MVDIIDDDFLVCTDCLMAIANGDTSGLDYYYSADEATRRLDEIHAGMAAAGGDIVPGETDRDEEFSRRDCDCCGCGLAGSRHHCVVLASI
jgi:hypothetical protein